MLVDAAANNATVPEAFGKLIALSAVGSITSNVVSLLSFVDPSKTTPLEVLITSTLFVVCVPDIDMFLTLNVSVLGL